MSEINQKGRTSIKVLPFSKIADRQLEPRSRSDISQVFEVDDIFNLWTDT
jgi:hypothetical protein